MNKRRRIIFSNIYDDNDYLQPVAARNLLPEWYKNTESYMGGGKIPHPGNNTHGTIKKCIPVFDALTSGYLILSPADVWVTRDKDKVPFFRWKENTTLSFHPVEQAEKHPENKGHAFLKWENPWLIQTPKGYSCIILHPVHRDLPFRILEGVVDTDTYYAPIKFVFVLKDNDWEGLIPAGTPIAQVIPFKRQKYKMEVKAKSDARLAASIKRINASFYNAYKSLFWQRKDYE